MKRLLRYVVILVGVAIVFVLGLLGYVTFFLPNVGAPLELKVEITPERLERGKYLANNVMLCMDCHAERDWSIYAGPPVESKLGAGGERFDHDMNFPGIFYAPNLTPAALSDWTDGEIFRAVTSGVSKDGRALFPIMPYLNYGQLEKEDIYSVIAYLRSLQPVEGSFPEPKFDFPLNFIVNTIPKPGAFNLKKDENYGEYLVTAAACFDCHTKQEKGKFVGEPYAGGFEFKFPDGSIVRSVNITFDEETGIGTWTREQFIQRFKMYVENGFVMPKVNPGEFQTPMPWLMYAGMTNEDLGAMYDYLKSLPKIKNPVDRFTPAEN